MKAVTLIAPPSSIAVWVSFPMIDKERTLPLASGHTANRYGKLQWAFGDLGTVIPFVVAYIYLGVILFLMGAQLAHLTVAKRKPTASSASSRLPGRSGILALPSWRVF